ncbi:MAG TPA: aminotransferase class V-fold PLP-dependent enzyme [Candidatus Acidoferrum sp.]|nr:aminotransferase class V-fold PLP-dependent enzyme [Candidatus Acidoferrum sp.]
MIKPQPHQKGSQMQKVDSAFRDALKLAVENAFAYLEGLEQSPVAATVDLQTLRSRLAKPLTDRGLPPEQVVTQLIRDVEGGLLGSAGGRFFGWVVGGSLPAALAADWLASAWDQNAALYATAPAAAVVEEVAGSWLKDILRLPAHASFALVSGCQMAHMTCLAAARHALLAKRGWDVEEKGLYAAPPIQILTSAEQHGSYLRAVRLLGLGRSQVTYLAADAQGRLLPGALEEALAKDPLVPTIVLLQAGEINIGAYDSFETVIPIAKRHGAWVHVDGAFGLWAAASPRFAHLVKGVALADSWATDGHKWLNVPYDCGYAFVADSESHRASMSYRAAYLTHDADARDEMNWNPEWSRRARGFPTYAALRQLGREGVAALVDRCCDHAHALVMGMGRLPGAQVLWEPVINQGLVRFLDPKPGATEEDHDRRTEEVMAAILASGEAFFGGTTWRGRRAMRVSVSSWQTSEKDVQRVVSAVAGILNAPVPSRSA